MSEVALSRPHCGGPLHVRPTRMGGCVQAFVVTVAPPPANEAVAATGNPVFASVHTWRPVQPPVHSVKSPGLLEFGLSVTVVAEPKSTVQLRSAFPWGDVPQVMPAGLLVTCPPPCTVTVSMNVGGPSVTVIGPPLAPPL